MSTQLPTTTTFDTTRPVTDYGPITIHDPDDRPTTPNGVPIDVTFNNQNQLANPYEELPFTLGPLDTTADTITIRRLYGGRGGRDIRHSTFKPSDPPTLTVTEFATIYGVDPALIPFDNRGHDPLFRLTQLRDYLHSLPELKATVTSKTVVENADIDGLDSKHAAIIPDTLYHLAGTRALTHSRDRGRSQRWINPNYVHLSSVETVPPEKRPELLDAFASLGVYSLRDLDALFGLGTDSLGRWTQRHDYPWADARELGRARISRTLAVITNWDYYELQELAPILGGITRSGLSNWRMKHATPDTFTPPDHDPVGAVSH